MASTVPRVILGPGVSFSEWETDVQAALAEKKRLAYVFHDIGMRPIVRPEKPVKAPNTTEAEFQILLEKYQDEVDRWIEGDVEAKNILVCRMSAEVRPKNYRKYTAKQLFEHAASTRQESAITPYELAGQAFFSTSFTTAEEYCDNFLQNLLSINSAAEALADNLDDKDSEINIYAIPDGVARLLFVRGTEGISWLDTWRETKVYGTDSKFVSLDKMMSSLRIAAGSRGHAAGQALVARKEQPDNEKTGEGPNDRCKLCKHRHKNKNCFKQHPELRSKSKKKNDSDNPTARVVSEVDAETDGESDSSSENLNLSKVARVSSAIKYKNSFLYDTGASHHFAHNVKDFISMQKLPRPFKFDQAIGSSSLTKQGTFRAVIGSLSLELPQTMYSPNSACNIISAVRLKREHKIVAAAKNKLLVKINKNEPDIPIARLVDTDGVLFIKPLKK